MDVSSRRLALMLSGLCFLTYLPSGAILTGGFTFLSRPLASGGLGLTPGQVAAVAAVAAVGFLAAIGVVYKLRFLTCRRVIAILSLVGVILMGILAAFSGAYAAARFPR